MKLVKSFTYWTLSTALIYGLSQGVVLAQEHDHHDHKEGDEHASHHGHNDEHKDHEGHYDHEDHDDHGQDDDGHGHEESSPVEWTSELIRESGISIKTASSAELSLGVELSGKIVSYEPNVAHIIPRFPGVIRKATKHLGEEVKKGDVLAVIESNKSLNPYQVRSPINGVVIKRHSTEGEYASVSEDIFVIADLSTVWGEFYVFSEDFSSVKEGLPVFVNVKSIETPIRSNISFVSRVVDEHTQSKFIRAVLANEQNQLHPGAFASALVVVESISAKVAVDASAIQRLDGNEVIFVWSGEKFEERRIITGKRNKEMVEILQGVNAGEKYASGNTFLIKAEIGKSEAEHAH
jgi:Membrane-fusion protein